MKNRWIEAEARRRKCKAVDIVRRRTVQRWIEKELLSMLHNSEPIPYSPEGWALLSQAVSRVFRKLGPPPVITVINELSDVAHDKETRYMCGNITMRIENE